ncbi:MFS transporter [Listeria booriae]|uniref:MFS transporter n=1 Tax=Listeria booriae TaxID=1552123 RepID=UPI0016246DF8|nr:MFS transporter [Listeria booriae]MBC2173676.1 MFS transporter [Listeria booriae]
MKKTKFSRWFIIAIIGMTGGMSFELPYLKYNYQVPMESLMGLSATQVGFIMSVYGTAAMILYAPSGIIADKFSHKKLITFSMLVTGGLAFVMALYPPYWMLLVIQVLLAITTVLFMWSATVKAVAILGTADEQGSLLGFAEGMRGFGALVTAFLTLWMFQLFGADSNPNSLKAVMITYGVFYIVFGILCWFVVPEETKQARASIPKAEKVTAKDIVTVLKKRTTWYCSLIIMGVYTIFAVLSYTTSYLIDIFAMPVVMATFIGMIRNQVFRTISGPVGAIVSAKTRLKSPTKIIFIGGIVTFAGLICLIVIPASKDIIFVMIGLVLLLAFFNYVSRGMYFATIGEAGTPSKTMGTTIGVASLIGFLPDVFIYPLIGSWQDTLEATQAYRNMWILGLVATGMALVFCMLLMRDIKKNKAVVMAAAETV